MRPYFPVQPGAPPPLRAVARRQVRFEEVDPLGIVWHGRYPSFFEDARVALGARYGINYLDFYERGIVTPIKKMHVDYRSPLRFQDEFTVEGILHWSEAARIDFEFVVRDAAERVTTTGYTVQLMLDRTDNALLLIPPPFYLDFRERWRRGEVR